MSFLRKRRPLTPTQKDPLDEELNAEDDGDGLFAVANRSTQRKLGFAGVPVSGGRTSPEIETHPLTNAAPADWGGIEGDWRAGSLFAPKRVLPMELPASPTPATTTATQMDDDETTSSPRRLGTFVPMDTGDDPMDNPRPSSMFARPANPIRGPDGIVTPNRQSSPVGKEIDDDDDDDDEGEEDDDVPVVRNPPTRPSIDTDPNTTMFPSSAIPRSTPDVSTITRPFAPSIVDSAPSTTFDSTELTATTRPTATSTLPPVSSIPTAPISHTIAPPVKPTNSEVVDGEEEEPDAPTAVSLGAPRLAPLSSSIPTLPQTQNATEESADQSTAPLAPVADASVSTAPTEGASSGGHDFNMVNIPPPLVAPKTSAEATGDAIASTAASGAAAIANMTGNPEVGAAISLGTIAGEALGNLFTPSSPPSPVKTITPGNSPRPLLGDPITAGDDIATVSGASNNAGVDSNVADEI